MNAVSLVGRPTLTKSTAAERRSDARWLITFADLAAVIVAFFVLLFAMAEVDSDKWKGATAAFDRQFRISEATITPRPVESANITQRVEEAALDLRYLERVVGEQLKEHAALRDVRVVVDADRLVLEFPGELVFASGRVGVSVSGHQSLFVLGGLFAGVENQVAVVGHAAPDQTIEGQPEIDWELSLMRAARIARSLRSAGYDRAIEVQGRSGSRVGGAAPAASDGPRTTLFQRIEIIVQNESGDGQ